MSKKINLFLCIVSLILSSCQTTYLLTSEGERFDALTKITDLKKPCIMPNGGDNNTNLVFSAREDDGSYNVYMKDKVLSSALIQKTDGDNYVLAPNYCAVNDKIVFQYFDKTNYDIYYINASKGKAITQVTNTDGNEYNPAWSKDGKLIIFERGAPPKQYIQTTTVNQGATRYTSVQTVVNVTKNQIWIKNIETGELKMIGEGSFPKFSPDGKEIAYVKYQLNKSKNIETGTIWIMSIDGEAQKQLTNPSLGYATHPAWAPDGKSIAFELTKSNKKDSDLYSISVDGENLKQYTTNKSNDFAPYWSSDGFMYFSSDRGAQSEKYQIWRFKIN